MASSSLSQVAVIVNIPKDIFSQHLLFLGEFSQSKLTLQLFPEGISQGKGNFFPFFIR